MIKFLQCIFVLLIGCAESDSTILHDTADTYAEEKADLDETEVDYHYSSEDLINVIVNLNNEDVEFYKNKNIYSSND